MTQLTALQQYLYQAHGCQSDEDYQARVLGYGRLENAVQSGLKDIVSDFNKRYVDPYFDNEAYSDLFGDLIAKFEEEKRFREGIWHDDFAYDPEEPTVLEQIELAILTKDYQALEELENSRNNRGSVTDFFTVLFEFIVYGENQVIQRLDDGEFNWSVYVDGGDLFAASLDNTERYGNVDLLNMILTGYMTDIEDRYNQLDCLGYTHNFFTGEQFIIS